MNLIRKTIKDTLNISELSQYQKNVALILAVKLKHINTVKTLLESGANSSFWNNTALELANDSKVPEIIELFYSNTLLKNLIFEKTFWAREYLGGWVEPENNLSENSFFGVNSGTNPENNWDNPIKYKSHFYYKTKVLPKQKLECHIYNFWKNNPKENYEIVEPIYIPHSQVKDLPKQEYDFYIENDLREWKSPKEFSKEEKIISKEKLKQLNTDGRIFCAKCGQKLKLVQGIFSNLNYCPTCEG